VFIAFFAVIVIVAAADDGPVQVGSAAATAQPVEIVAEPLASY
jgi:hypothetical protein